MYNYSVKDSSIYQHAESYSAYNSIDNTTNVGIVREVFLDDLKNLIYTVEVTHMGAAILINCIMMTRFYGPLNYEEYNLFPYLDNTIADDKKFIHRDSLAIKNGDVVVVAFLGGNAREGVILGSLKNAKRLTALKPTEIAYLSEFNGLETKIKNDGTYKITWKSKPTINPVPPTPASYDITTGGSYYGFDTNGSYYVTDDAMQNKQFITIKKDKNTISIVSGSNRIEIGKTDLAGTDSLGINTKVTVIKSDEFSLTSSNVIKIKSQDIHIKGVKVAIGNEQVELIKFLMDLIDKIGTIIVTSPYGPCSPVNQAPTWISDILPMKDLLGTLKLSVKDPTAIKSASDSDNFKD